jgi:hypothetical protein
VGEGAEENIWTEDGGSGRTIQKQHNEKLHGL